MNCVNIRMQSATIKKYRMDNLFFITQWDTSNNARCSRQSSDCSPGQR